MLPARLSVGRLNVILQRAPEDTSRVKGDLRDVATSAPNAQALPRLTACLPDEAGEAVHQTSVERPPRLRKGVPCRVTTTVARGVVAEGAPSET